MGDILLVEEVLNKTRFVIKSHRIDDYIDNKKYEFISYNDFVNNPAFKEFTSEIIAYINLIHPNIVDFYGFDIVRGVPRILLLYVEGGNLHEWIHQKKLSSFKTIIEILIQIATALKYSHEHRLLHRDIKPLNILMEKYNSNNQFIVKIADFGLVKLLKNKHLSSYNIQEEKDKNFLTEKYVGTCGYASPEQASLIHGKIIDENTDIFSFGQVACEMICDGKKPQIYKCDNLSPVDGSLITDVSTHIKNFFKLYNPKCPENLIKLIIKCLQVNPEDRWNNEKKEGTFHYFETILEQLNEIYLEITGDKYEFFYPDVLYDKDLEYILRGKTLQKLGYPVDKVETFLSKIQNIKPTSSIGWSNRGKFLSDLGKHEEALECYDEAIKIDNKNMFAWYNKGNTLHELNRLQEALECYDEAIKIEKNYNPIWYYKGHLLEKLNKNSEALECYDEAIKIDKNDIDSWYNKGSILEEQGHYSQALECYDEAIKIDKDFFLAWLNKGNILSKILNNLGESASSKLQLYDEAEICYNNAIKLNSHFAVSHYYLAILKIKRYLLENNDKHKKEGFQALMNAIKLQPQLKNAVKSSEVFIKFRDDKEFKEILES